MLPNEKTEKAAKNPKNRATPRSVEPVLLIVVWTSSGRVAAFARPRFVVDRGAKALAKERKRSKLAVRIVFMVKELDVYLAKDTANDDLLFKEQVLTSPFFPSSSISHQLLPTAGS